jgi:hypothetical protein
MGLNIYMVTAKQFLRTVPRKIFSFIHYFAASVIPLVRIPFSILVGKHRTHGCQNCRGYNVLRCYKLYAMPFSLKLFTYDPSYGWIHFPEIIRCFSKHLHIPPFYYMVPYLIRVPQLTLQIPDIGVREHS